MYIMVTGLKLSGNFKYSYLELKNIFIMIKIVLKEMKSPIVFDEDCKELSPAMMKAFKSAVVQRNRKKKA